MWMNIEQVFGAVNAEKLMAKSNQLKEVWSQWRKYLESQSETKEAGLEVKESPEPVMPQGEVGHNVEAEKMSSEVMKRVEETMEIPATDVFKSKGFLKKRWRPS